MLTIPNIIVGCDGCTRSITLSTWSAKLAVVDQLKANGWTLLAANQNETIPAYCPSCASKVAPGK